MCCMLFILHAYLRMIYIVFTFRHVLWHFKDIDSYFGVKKNRVDFQQRVYSFGTVGIKFCQWLSQRIDLLSPNTILALEYFQRSVPEHAISHTLNSIEMGTKQSWKKTFMTIGKVIGSGSISQVHTCTHTHGQHGVIKVMHPHIQDNIDKNIEWFCFLVPCIQYIYPPTKIFNLKEFVNTISVQTDYISEATNQNILRNVLSMLDFVIVPQIYEYNTHFIFQEKCTGFTRQDICNDYPEYIVDMAEKTQAAYFWMSYCGYIHCDLHDGNTLYMIDENDDSNNKLVILDYGLVFDLKGKKGRVVTHQIF